ncbi:MAG: selenocysteine-specific translation elongation factor [candidate division Zixibacteria bacterium]
MMFVLGTAGHIDHGKSSLIEAITGIDPDRLPEEKQRGMTIDLGFAWMKLTNGEEIGLVDVPGHERFVRNMVAGAGGINAALLVIAADDGWMPQTQEHFDILKLLNLEYGLIALTKTDLVESDWVGLISSDIKEKIKGSFLENAPIIPCSSETGEGIPEIVNAVGEMAMQIKAVEDIGKPRLFIDRSFILTGIGVVITGTSRGGGFSADSEVYHFPSGDKIRIRSLQSHEKQVDNVGPGTRVAINLTGADKEKVKRGDVICGFPYKKKPEVFTADISNLADSALVLSEGRKVLLIYGTTEAEAILRPVSDSGIKPGETGIAVIKSLSPICAFVGDYFILRLPTPQKTIGGGKILDILENMPRRKVLNSLLPVWAKRIDGSLESLLLTELEKQLFMNANDILFYSIFSDRQIFETLKTLEISGKIIINGDYVGLAARINDLTEKISILLGNLHKKKSYLRGMTGENIAGRTKQVFDSQFILFLKYLENENKAGRVNQFYHLPGFKPSLDDAMRDQSEKILGAIKTAGHSYLTIAEIERKFENSRRTINFLRDEGKIRIVAPEFIVSSDSWKEILEYLENKFDENGKLTLAEFRNHFQTTRKYVLPLLEFLDQIKITKRDGDFRIKGASFDERHSI